MASPRLVTAASSIRTEAEVRELAIAKVRAEREYKSLVMAPVTSLNDAAEAELQIKIARARKALFAADAALQGAV
jgi:hypothetical protein